MIPAVPVPILCGEKISDSKYTAVGASGLSGYSTTMVTDSVFVSHCTFIRQINLAFCGREKIKFSRQRFAHRLITKSSPNYKALETKRVLGKYKHIHRRRCSHVKNCNIGKSSTLKSKIAININYICKPLVADILQVLQVHKS